MKILFRLLAFPFILSLAILSSIMRIGYFAYHFLMYGGETMVYLNKDEPKTINDIYTELKKFNNNNK